MQLLKFKNGLKKKDKQISKIYLLGNIFISLNRFPLFTAVHEICERRLEATALIDALRYHPEFW
jgi:hypothetical protein